MKLLTQRSIRVPHFLLQKDNILAVNSDSTRKTDCITTSRLFAIICERLVVSQIEAGANSAKTVKASATPRVTLGLQVYL